MQIYGGSNINLQFLHPFVVSVDASPLTNRASWVKPPYETAVTLEPLTPSCSTICLASSQYYLRTLNRLPNGAVLISGVNYNTPVNTDNTTAMRSALDGGNSAQDRFNAQFVALQLSLLAAPGSDQGALQSKLSCYGVSFSPVTLGSGATLTPNATLGTLLDLARNAARNSAGADLSALANLLAQLNGQCRR